MKLDPKEIMTAAGTTPGIGGIPPWMSKLDEIVKNVDGLFKTYAGIQGRNAPPSQLSPPAAVKPSFEEARMAKKYEQEGRIPAAGKATGEFMELLDGLIKTATTLEQMGNGKVPVGEAIMALPFTVEQAREFLQKLRKQRYG